MVKKLTSLSTGFKLFTVALLVSIYPATIQAVKPSGVSTPNVTAAVVVSAALPVPIRNSFSPALAFNASPGDAALIPQTEAPLLKTRPFAKQSTVPTNGLSAWKSGNIHQAAAIFTHAADKGNAASAFWAYRAHNKLGMAAKAQHYLKLSAKSDDFYGILARKALHKEFTYDAAQYRIPSWKPEQGYRVDPALIYALALKESNFKTIATSHRGARGVLQLMPQTAYAIHRLSNASPLSKAAVTQKLNEPGFNLAIGQSYLRHLQQEPAIGNNLIYVLAAYNAGPGKVEAWQTTAKSDPLLFMESIPYRETRYYVKQVLANYWIYAQITTSHTDSAEALLAGNWPKFHSKTSLAERN